MLPGAREVQPAPGTPDSAAADLSRFAAAWLVATAFLSGCGVMTLEMTAVRAMAPFFGATTHTWTNVIGVILGALAAGYYLGGRFADRFPRPALLYWTLLSGGVLVLLLPLVLAPVSRWLLPAELRLEGAITVANRASLVATLALFAPPVLLLGGISPMTIKLLTLPGRVGSASGRIFAFSTLGSILGTFATTLWLIPSFGSRLTIAFAGGLLVLTAIVGFLVFAFSRRSLVMAVLVSVGVLLVILSTANAGPLKSASGQILEIESPYQYIRVRELRPDYGPAVRLLQFNEAEETYQSVRALDSVLTGGRYYDYYSVLPFLLEGEAAGDGLDVLVLGLAAGTIPAQLRHFHPEGLRVTGVEIDPVVLETGVLHFGMPRRALETDGSDFWLRAVVADARIYLQSLPAKPRFDLIVIDAFSNEFYIPFHLATREMFALARSRLRAGGILAMNVAAPSAASPLVSAVEATVADVFESVSRTRVRGYTNFLLFAMKETEPDLGRLLRLSPRSVAEWEELEQIAKRVGSETVRVPRGNGLVLTDDRAPVEDLIDDAVREEGRGLLGVE